MLKRPKKVKIGRWKKKKLRTVRPRRKHVPHHVDHQQNIFKIGNPSGEPELFSKKEKEKKRKRKRGVKASERPYVLSTMMKHTAYEVLVGQMLGKEKEKVYKMIPSLSCLVTLKKKERKNGRLKDAPKYSHAIKQTSVRVKKLSGFDRQTITYVPPNRLFVV